jgi:hypothetical protein
VFSSVLVYIYWPAVAQNISVGLPTVQALVQYQVVNVWIVVGKIKQGLVILRGLRLPLSVIIPSVRGWYNAALVAAVTRDCVPLLLLKHKETVDIYNFI